MIRKAFLMKLKPCRRWWAYRAELMLTNSDESPVSENPDEVFHLD